MIDWRTEEHKVAVVQRLLALAKGPGAPLVAVWWDGGLPRVRYALWSAIEVLTWLEAEGMTGVYWHSAPPRKGMGRAGRLPERLASGF